VKEKTTVFTYRCPGCGKRHLAEVDFEDAFETRCLRCGEAFHVSPEMVHGLHVTTLGAPAATGLEDLFTARNPDSADVEGAADGDERVPLADSSLESGLEAIATEGGDERERVGGTSRALTKRRGSEPEADVRAEARLHPDDIADETIAGSAGVPNNVD